MVPKRLLLLLFPFALACDTSDAPPEMTSEDSELVCYDAYDNDGDGAIDCADTECDFATCCVGVASDACCDAFDPVYSVDFQSCANDFTGCAPEWTLVGVPSFYPYGTDGAAPATSTMPMAMVLSDPLDLDGSRYRIEFEVARPSCVDCLSFVSVGVIPTPPMYAGFYESGQAVSTVLRSESVVGYGTEGRLNRYGSEFARFDVEDDAFHRYVLELSPEGRGRLSEVDDTGAELREIGAFDYHVESVAYLMISGLHGENATGAPGRVGAIDVTRSRCDMPARTWVSPDTVTPRLEAPLAYADDLAWARNAAGGELVLVGNSLAGDHYAFQRDTTGGYGQLGPAPVLDAAILGDASVTRLSDPWLVADESAGRWRAFVTAWRDTGRADIGRIDGNPGFAASFDPTTFAIVATGNDRLPELSQPTVDGDIMIARAGRGSLAVFTRLDRRGDQWIPHAGTLSDSVVLRPRYGDGEFDSDAISDPALIRHDGLLRLYYTGAYGTRSDIGVLVSVDGFGWKRIQDDALWERIGGSYFALRALEPNPIADGRRVEMLFLGLDSSVRGGVGYATSGAPASWPFEDTTP